MKSIGYIITPGGPYGIDTKKEFYELRQGEFGPQVKIKYLGSFIWINVRPEYIKMEKTK